MFPLICTRINGWVNNGEAGDMRRYRAHYDVTVMKLTFDERQKYPSVAATDENYDDDDDDNGGSDVDDDDDGVDAAAVAAYDNDDDDDHDHDHDDDAFVLTTSDDVNDDYHVDAWLDISSMFNVSFQTYKRLLFHMVLSTDQ